METETIPVVIGAVGLINNGLKKHMEEIPGAISLNELNNILIKNSSHTGKGSVLTLFRPGGGLLRPYQTLKLNNFKTVKAVTTKFREFS